MKYFVLYLSFNVLYSPPYLNVVMQNCCIRKSKVLSQMYSTRLMGDTCFNNIVEKNISSFCVLLCHMGFHRNTAKLPENCYFTKNISRLFNNDH